MNGEPMNATMRLPGVEAIVAGPTATVGTGVEACRRVAFFVPGEPKPMGSKSAFIVKGQFGPRAIVTDGKAGKAIKGWKDSVIAAAMTAIGDGARILGPVSVTITFSLARPAGQLGKDGLPRRSAPKWPAVKPDLDKLTRSTLDALAVVLLGDDSRVVTMALEKVYADHGPTGATIEVEELA